MKDVLSVISDEMTALDLNYEYVRMTKSPVVYPYWVGEISDNGSKTEDGMSELSVILTGFTRNSYIELETEKAKIKDRFIHGVTVMKNGAAIAIFYDGCINIPVEDDDLKKSQINLIIKNWKGR